MRKKKTKKEEKIELVEEKVEVIETEVGKVLPITADKKNPVSDGLEFIGGDKDE